MAALSVLSMIPTAVVMTVSMVVASDIRIVIKTIRQEGLHRLIGLTADTAV